MKALIFAIFLLSTNCFAVQTLKATGNVRAKIVSPVVFEVPTAENLTDNFVIVYTEQGATAQVVF